MRADINHFCAHRPSSKRNANQRHATGPLQKAAVGCTPGTMELKQGGRNCWQCCAITLFLAPCWPLTVSGLRVWAKKVWNPIMKDSNEQRGVQVVFLVNENCCGWSCVCQVCSGCGGWAHGNAIVQCALVRCPCGAVARDWARRALVLASVVQIALQFQLASSGETGARQARRRKCEIKGTWQEHLNELRNSSGGGCCGGGESRASSAYKQRLAGSWGGIALLQCVVFTLAWLDLSVEHGESLRASVCVSQRASKREKDTNVRQQLH